jgi:exopolyphosphatase/guanosine-5'-triphosphate,3'-diphosphate pyrophosphatase
MKLGILDIGTNSIHVFIAEVGKDTSFEILGRAKEMVRLGDGSLKSGVIPRAKMERGLAVVKHFAQLARNRGVNRLLGVATAVIREASNGGEFVERVQRETGLKVRTVTGDEEARLICLAVRHYMHLTSRPVLTIDIGGGSAELIVANDKGMQFARSLKLGSARLKDLFITKYPVPRSDLDRLRRHLCDVLTPTLEEIAKFRIQQVIGTSGTIINLGSVVSEQRDGRTLTNPQGFSYSRGELEDVIREIARSDEDEIESIKGVDPARWDILLPGACLIREALEYLGLKEITLCDKGIREGVILDYIAKNSRKLALEAEIPNVRLRSVLQFANRCEFEQSHGKQAARLALALYDQLPVPGELHPAARELLEYGAMLHDIGYHVSYDAHHKHGWYLIKNSELYGFTPEEIDIIACIVRFHRKKSPKRIDPHLAQMPKANYRTVAYCAAIVRVADALDRSHFNVVESLKAAVSKKAAVIRVFAKNDPAMELWTARQKVGLLEKELGREVVLEAAKRSVSKNGNGHAKKKTAKAKAVRAA